jgi:hypothetical protein
VGGRPPGPPTVPGDPGPVGLPFGDPGTASFVVSPGVPAPGDSGVTGDTGDTGVTGVAPTSVFTAFVVIRVVQVTKLPPPFSEPLHWSTVTGKSELTVPDALQVITPPPPVPDPLHWVTVADPVELGMHPVMRVPPPPPEPMHWFSVIAVAAAGALALMLLTMLTEQMVVLPPTLSEPLHWCTALMTFVGTATSPVQSSNVQTLVETTVEVPPVASMVLIMLTEHVTDSGAPRGPAPWALHCEYPTVAADAGVEADSNTTAVNPAASTAAANTAAMIRKRRRPRGRSLVELDMINTPPH